MINTQGFSVPRCAAAEAVLRTHTLGKNVAAIQLLNADKGNTKLGMITQLPRGAELQICGDGFNERTVRVRWAEGYYFVFLQDLEVQLNQFACV
jgi:hypothetical protein